MPGWLNRRLLAWFLLFSIVPLIATNAVGYRRSHQIIRGQAQHSLTSIAAVQATAAGGRVAVGATYADGGLRFEIADTGRGIPAAEVEAVFKPFFTTRYTGTRLGLPITREIVQRYGGTVTPTSDVRTGTTVVLHLPEHGTPGMPPAPCSRATAEAATT